MDFAVADIQFVYQRYHLVCDVVWSLSVRPEFGIDIPSRAIYVVLGDPDFVAFHEFLLAVMGIVMVFSDSGGGIHGQLCVFPDIFTYISYFFCFWCVLVQQSVIEIGDLEVE